MTQTERWTWCVWMGIVTSSAISIKWTALATPGMIGENIILRISLLEQLLGNRLCIYFCYAGRAEAAATFVSRRPRKLLLRPPFITIAVESFGAIFFLRRSVPLSDLLRVAAVAFILYSHWFW